MKVYRSLLCGILAVILALIYVCINTEMYSSRLEKSVMKQKADEERVGVDNTDEETFDIAEVSYAGKKNEENLKNRLVSPSGEAIGIYVKAKGVMVTGIGQVKAENGLYESPCEGIFLPGDYITCVNGNKISDKNELIEYVNSSGGQRLDFTLQRDDALLSCSAVPEKNSDGRYMLGLWVKDDISGIGTLTYTDSEGFAALGHSINDSDTGKLFSTEDGAIYQASLINLVKPEGDMAGRIEGLIDYSNSNIIGRVSSNNEYGIAGKLTSNAEGLINNDEWMPVASRNEVHTGKACIKSGVSGKSEYYDIEIVEVYKNADCGNKSILIEITDSRLLQLTNGIIQGMSGTPIIQDGKLVGAVTHVFIKDPTRGYATFAEDMLR